MWPGLAGTGTGSAGRRLGLGLEVPAEGRDWVALGLGSVVQGAGLGLERSASEDKSKTNQTLTHAVLKTHSDSDCMCH
eukprot:302474-Prymnesium_polylepis.1